MVRSLAVAVLATLATTLSLPAHAEAVDASAFTCQELTEALNSTDKESQYGGFVLLSWLAGYNATEEQGTVVDFDSLKVDTGKVVDFCAKNPKIGVMSASAKFMGDNATPITKEAVDLATLKCERLAVSTQDDVEGAGVILMWLAGYFASYDEETMIDFDELGRQGSEIGNACSESLQMGLVTATRKVMQVE